MAVHTAGRRLIAVWAVPRSVSTAFEKTFAGRPDAAVVHEPFTDCYYFGGARCSARYGDQAHKRDRDAAWALREIDRHRTPVVVVKDLCFQAEPYLPDDFLAAAANTFILRHPAVVLSSLTPLKSDFTEEEFGFLALHRLWRRVMAASDRAPVVVEGDIFRARPEPVLRRYCEQVGLDFDPHMLHWSDGRIRSWSADERESQAKWHRTLETSTGILPPRPRPPAVVGGALAGAYDRAVRIYEEISPAALEFRPFVR